MADVYMGDLKLKGFNHFTRPFAARFLIPESRRVSPEDFQGFRFSNARAGKSEDVHRYQLTMTSPQAMHFGYGRNACPGRFFVRMVIKAFAASILVNFDLKVAKERPKSRALGSRNSPPRDTEILLRVKPG